MSLRVLTNGRGAHPLIDANTLHLWAFHQASSGAALVDLVNGSQNLTVVGTPPSGIVAPIGLARSTLAGNYFNMTSTAPAADTTALLGACTVEAWVRPTSFAVFGKIVGVGLTGGTSAQNRLIEIAINTAKNVRVRWDHGAGVSVTYTSTLTVSLNEWVHIAVVRSGAASPTVSVYINGVLIETSGALTAPDGGASGRWAIGTDPSALNSFNFVGGIDSIRVSSVARTTTEIEESFRRGMMWTAFGATTHARVLVADGSTDLASYPVTPAADLSAMNPGLLDWLHSVSLADSVDDAGPTGTVCVFQEEQAYASLSKWHDNPMNRTPVSGIGPATTTYTKDTTEVLGLARPVNMYLARMPWGFARPGSSSTDWQLMVQGVADSLKLNQNPIEIPVIDHITANLMKGCIKTEVAYAAGLSFESVMQSIINNAFTDGAIAADLNTGVATLLYTPVASTTTLSAFTQRCEPVLVALKTLADQIGWTVRVMWDAGTAKHRLTFFEPDRYRAGADYAVVNSDDYYSVSQLAIAMRDIRTTTRVPYAAMDGVPGASALSTTGFTRTTGVEGGTATDGAGTINWVQWENDAAVLKYGRVFNQLPEAAAMYINTYGQADMMAKAVCSDLCEPLADHGVTGDIFFQLQVGTSVNWKANNHNYTLDQLLSVVNWKIALSGDGKTPPRMDVMSRGAPCSGVKRHLEKEARGGNAKPPPPDGFSVLTGITLSQARMPLLYMAQSTPHLRQGRLAGIKNGDFSDQLHSLTRPPTNWNVGDGTWGTDYAIEKTKVASGIQAVKFLNAKYIDSDPHPVMAGFPIVAEAVWARDASGGSTAAGKMFIYWFQDMACTIASGTTLDIVFNAVVPGDTNYRNDRAKINVPSDARACKIRIAKTGGTGNIYFDRVGITPIQPNFKVYSGATLTLGVKAITQVKLDSESWDNGSNFDPTTAGYPAATTCRYLCAENGDHEFVASIQVKSNVGNGGVVTTQLLFYKNNALWLSGPISTNKAGINSSCNVFYSGIQNLAQGDYVQLYVYADDQGGGTGQPVIQSGADVTYMTGKLVNHE